MGRNKRKRNKRKRSEWEEERKGFFEKRGMELKEVEEKRERESLVERR